MDELEMNMPMMNCSMKKMMSMGMSMVFHFDSCLQLLFESWKIQNPGELVGAIVAVFAVAVLYEGLKTVREFLMHYESKRRRSTMQIQDEKTPLLTKGTSINAGNQQSSKLGFLKQYFHWLHLLQSVLHVVQVGIGYLLMLVAMTYNGWLFLAVCFGAGVGYLLFARTRYLMDSREKSEPCGH